MTVADVLPLSPLQQGLLFHSLCGGEAEHLYVLQCDVELRGRLDVPRLRRAVSAVVRRHSVLRSTFNFRASGEAVQVVRADAGPAWRHVEATDPGPVLDDEWGREFDLETGPLARWTLVDVAPEHAVLALTVHHLVSDGWSTPVLLEELFALYRSDGDDSALPPVTPYRAYLEWLGKRDHEQARTAWRHVLGDLTAGTFVAPGATLSVDATPGTVTRELSAETTAALTGQARARRTTLSTICRAVWALALSELTGTRDVVFGSTVSGRPTELAGFDRMVGLFVNTVPVRVRLDGGMDAVLDRLREQHWTVIDHEHLGLGDVQRCTGVSGPLFDTLLAFENHPEAGACDVDGHVGVTGVREREFCHYPLVVNVTPGEHLRLRVDHRTDVVGRATADALATRLRDLLEDIARSPA